MSAVSSRVRVTAGCGRSSAVQTKGRHTMPWARKARISLWWRDVFRSTAACAASPQAAAPAAIEDATHVQSRAASCDSSGGEKISSSGLCFCESSGRVLVLPRRRECTHRALGWLRRYCRFRRAQVELPRMIHVDGVRQPPCRLRSPNLFCTLVMLSCGGKTLPAHV